MTKLLKKISFILSDFIVLMNLRICVKWTQPQVICLYVLQSHCIGPCLENAIHARYVIHH